MKTVKRILTGIRPTGPLHLGHYKGALENWLKLQTEDYDCFFLIADVQALTTHWKDPELVEKSVSEVLLDWLAIGLDPARLNVHFVLQSAIRELPELTYYLGYLVSIAELERNPTIKDEAKSVFGKKSMPWSFFGYPVSQAADILFVSAGASKILVPVGEDQIPHLEQTNRVTRAFNRQYGKVLVPCSPLVGEFPRLPGLGGPDEKMSKSKENAIYLKDEAESVTEKVRSMYTDPKKIRKGDPGHPEGCVVRIFHEAFGSEGMDQRLQDCKSGKLGCVDCKKALAANLNAFLDPIRQKRQEFEAKPEQVKAFLVQGTKEAREIAKATMEQVRAVMHLDYSSFGFHE